MVTVWFGVGQFLSGAMGQLYPGGDRTGYPAKYDYDFSYDNYINHRIYN